MRWRMPTIIVGRHRPLIRANPQTRCGQTTLVGSRCLVGLAYELVEPRAQRLWYLDGPVLGAEPAEYAGGCLERGWAAGTGVEVLLNLDAGGLLERSFEQVMRMRACVAARERGRRERRERGVGEGGDQPRPSALDALVGRFGPDIEQLRDFRRRPVFGVMEHERDSVGGSEPAQRRAQRELIFGRSGDGRGVLDVGDQRVELARVGGSEISASAVGIGDGASEDASQPPSGRRRIPELMARSSRALERVLHGVLGVVLLAGQAPREREQLRQLTLDPRPQIALAVSAVVGGCPVSVSHHVLRVGTSHKTEVAQMSFVSFMRSSAGRRLRIAGGGALIVAGLAIGGTGMTILAIVGVVPLAAGAFNVCLFAPLFGLDFMGHKRAAS